MKKFKRIVVSALTVVMLVGMMAIPASAATKSKSFTEERFGYSFTGKLSITDTSASATLEGTRIPGQVLNHIDWLEIQGTVTYTDSRGNSYVAPFSGWYPGLSVDAYFSVSGATPTAATATYYVNDGCLDELAV